jgi:hypothetical protein
VWRKDLCGGDEREPHGLACCCDLRRVGALVKSKVIGNRLQPDDVSGRRCGRRVRIQGRWPQARWQQAPLPAVQRSQAYVGGDAVQPGPDRGSPLQTAASRESNVYDRPPRSDPQRDRPAHPRRLPPLCAPRSRTTRTERFIRRYTACTWTGPPTSRAGGAAADRADRSAAHLPSVRLIVSLTAALAETHLRLWFGHSCPTEEERYGLQAGAHRRPGH